MSAIDDFWAVIPAGGAGTRLWPLSRAGSPKFLHDLTSTGRSLLQQTWARLEPLAEDRFVVVTGRSHEKAVTAQLREVTDPGRPDRAAALVLAEPSPRDSMAAIGLAAAVLERRAPQAVMGSFAADHVITDADEFARAVRTAVAAARQGWLVTLGIEPTSPSPAFGYIHLGEPLDGPSGTEGARHVRAFVEKPTVEVARAYLSGGDHRWNAGMFVVRPGVLLDLLAERDPSFAAALRSVAEDPQRLEVVWPTLPRIAVDHAVAEPAAEAGRVAVVPAGFGWEDVGDFDALAGLLADATGPDRPDRPGGPVVLGAADDVCAVDASGLVVAGSGRTIAVVGLEDVVVVDTPDAVLVTTRARAQEVKEVVARLREQGRTDLL